MKISKPQPGWKLIDGIWQGPFPWNETHLGQPRMCANCGAELAECMGSVKIGDILPALRGEPLKRFPRELCFICATLRGCHWGGPDGEKLIRKPRPRKR